jgi:hypothetical protein
VPNSATSSTGRLWVRKPAAASDLSGGGRKQEVRQDEQGRRQVGVERAFLVADAEVEQQADDRLAIDVVVERTQRLGQEERQETPLLEQFELVVRHAACGSGQVRTSMCGSREGFAGRA